MHNKILIVLFVLAVIYYIYTKQSAVENFSIPFTDITGYDLTNQRLANEDLCLQACEKDPKCLFYNYDTVGQTCWMKQGMPNSNFEVGLYGNRLIHGDNVDLNFNVLNTTPVTTPEECSQMSSSKGHNVWKFDKTGKKCLSGKIGVSRPNLTTGSTQLSQSCPPPTVCPAPTTCPPPTTCPTPPPCPSCPTCPPPTVCPSCPTCNKCEECKKCWLPALL